MHLLVEFQMMGCVEEGMSCVDEFSDVVASVERPRHLQHIPRTPVQLFSADTRENQFSFVLAMLLLLSGRWCMMSNGTFIGAEEPHCKQRHQALFPH
jgi:hypothetical protein